jgi:hypothetical protein
MKCALCGETKEDSYATTLNSKIVYACLDCYLKQCAVINSNYEKDENYKKESDLPQDVIERLGEIAYPVDKFLREVVFDSDTSMREWLHCCESNRGHYPKEHQDLSDKIEKVKGHPSLNEFQRKRIEAYLKSGLSIRDVQRAIHADNFEASYGTIKSIRKKLTESNSDRTVGNQES